mmetsp:Transcript_100711/g.178804  ORF Transcript_100711/g.178804 Transcript_100711/m.178804 type:complete len:1154 (+) Transcript_100711:49-3510(+)|eukprot:CAMPEP_0197626446 /NCGR_PEP_ID=MMETSP1338-20131121/5409_1 /TAXON_ID=43686 ORGANISM="Pelagodinium beii, Strain RCC1491" /NCGR_SAMPLE_ID=MMETSP1338 /ASSEMBLY_ACC=CAM_ASM_000754 /LENGTH=1153 /DNA_ID=CAMNT_0043196987 /DNA_START=47 /DNA_END=3508 /DNA_ORIENTATION=+
MAARGYDATNMLDERQSGRPLRYGGALVVALTLAAALLHASSQTLVLPNGFTAWSGAHQYKEAVTLRRAINFNIPDAPTRETNVLEKLREKKERKDRRTTRCERRQQCKLWKPGEPGKGKKYFNFKPMIPRSLRVNELGNPRDPGAPRSPEERQRYRQEKAKAWRGLYEAEQKKKAVGREERKRQVQAAALREEKQLPVVYSSPPMFQRLAEQPLKPGHLIQRKWLKKGRSQGFATIPFATALRSTVADPDINICLISRRQESDKVAKAWQKQLETLPTFDVSGVAYLSDLDPLEPPWTAPLDQPLPSSEAVRKMADGKRTSQEMRQRYLRGLPEPTENDAKILRQVVEGLPLEVRESEDTRDLIRQTVVEVIKVCWSVQSATNATRLRWRLACTDDELEVSSSETSLRSIFILAGEALEFVPKTLVSEEKVAAESFLSDEQIRRMPAEDWAASVIVDGANSSEALKVVPPGWTTTLKGASWPGIEGSGAVYRLPQSGKRFYIEVDSLPDEVVVKKVKVEEKVKEEIKEEIKQTEKIFFEEAAVAKDSGEAGIEELKSLAWVMFREQEFLQWLAGIAAAIAAVASRTPFFRAGRSVRRQVDDTLSGIFRVYLPPSSVSRRQEAFEEERLQAIQNARLQFELLREEQRAEAARQAALEAEDVALEVFRQQQVDAAPDADDDAPVVLVVGGNTETGQAVTRRLSDSGYHYVVAETVLNKETLENLSAVGRRKSADPKRRQPKSVKREMKKSSRGKQAEKGGHEKQVLKPGKPVSAKNLNGEIYDLVAGTDKLVVCDCEEKPTSARLVKNLISAWQLYRADFSEGQKAFQSKVSIFNFRKEADFELWDVERITPSDMCYGGQDVTWLQNPRTKNEARYSGEFFPSYDGERSAGQTQLRSPLLKLNFSKFSGLLVSVRNRDMKNKYAFFLRTSHFQRTRIQYEFDLELEPGGWKHHRMPFASFKPIRTDGVELPEEEIEEFPFQREDVVQMGFVFRTDGQVIKFEDKMREPFFSLEIDSVKACRAQKEPQVLYVGRSDSADQTQHDAGSVVMRSGLCYAMVKAKEVNDNPDGHLPVVLHQAPVDRLHPAESVNRLEPISRGDVAAIATHALQSAHCVGTEIFVGQTHETDSHEHGVEIASTVEEHLRRGLKQLSPNT